MGPVRLMYIDLLQPSPVSFQNVKLVARIKESPTGRLGVTGVRQFFHRGTPRQLFDSRGRMGRGGDAENKQSPKNPST